MGSANILTFTLPAGSYVVIGQVSVRHGEEQKGRCQINYGAIAGPASLWGGEEGGAMTVPVMSTVTITAPTAAVTMSCSITARSRDDDDDDHDSTVTYRPAFMTAFRVATLA